MKLAEKRNRSPEKSIVNLQGGKPLLLGNDIDENVRKYTDFTPQRRTGNFYNYNCSRKSLNRAR